MAHRHPHPHESRCLIRPTELWLPKPFPSDDTRARLTPDGSVALIQAPAVIVLNPAQRKALREWLNVHAETPDA